jgi:hypothetical protein
VIKYNLPEPVAVTLEIYDMLGHKIVALYDGNQPAGEHSLIWKADGFASGIYFYKLTAGEYSETRKMTLVK